MRAGNIHDGRRKDYGGMVDAVMGGMELWEAAVRWGLSYSRVQVVVRREMRRREVRMRFHG
jgi:hypothetical protein